jgi:hypothetical protein
MTQDIASVPTVLTGGVSQAESTVLGDQTGRDSYRFNTTINQAAREATVLELLLASLHAEVEHKLHCQDMIAKLHRYHSGTSGDGVDGLLPKLEHAGRGDEIGDALEQKEMFAKLLEEWSLYASAQEIFVHLLAWAEHMFKSEIRPQLKALPPVAVNELVNRRIVDPTVAQCGATVLRIDHLTAMGMVYWLAERCFVRWH